VIDPSTTLVILPLKATAMAKTRLAGIRSPSERVALALALATGVVDALNGRPILVVHTLYDDAVASWALNQGLDTILAPPGLDQAADAGRQHARAHGFGRTVICHGDLSRPEGIGAVLERSGSFVVPDRRHDGTNVLAIPTDSSFAFSYGPGSLQRHVAEAERVGVTLAVINDVDLGLDVDEPEDLELHLFEDTSPNGPRGTDD